MSSALIECLYPMQHEMLPLGARLLDLSVNLTDAFAQDCPPISYFRVVLRERAWLRSLAVAAGEQHPVGALIATFSTSPDEADDAGPARPIRVMTAGIIHHPGMWSGNHG